MTFPVLPANGPSGYNLTNSLRFRSSASAYLNRTPASAGNRKTWTWSGWVKRGALSTSILFSAGTSAGNQLRCYIGGGNNLNIDSYVSGVYAFQLYSSQVLRDPSAWYHIAFAFDTTQGTSSNRIKVYLNGEQITAFNTASYPALNSDSYVNNTISHYLGNNPDNYYLDGYLTEVNFIDGQALTPSSFGSTNAVTGVWQPAKYTGTYGTNGFYLPFTDATSTTTLGNDFSGNGNNWTTNNISLTPGATYDAMTDVPTLTSPTAANFAVMNPLNALAPATLTEGNLTLSSSTAAWRTALSTIQLPLTGKWYFECTIGSGGVGNGVEIGLVSYDQTVYRTYKSTGTKNSNTGGVVAYGSSYGASAVIGVAIDSDAGTIAFYNNNTAQGTAFTDVTSAVPASGWYLAVQANNSSNHAANFGQRPFAYTPPSGFVALNTFNLPSSTIPNGANFMAADIYTGNGSSQTRTLNFQPDFIWNKIRSQAYDHNLFDVLRGVDKRLISNLTSQELTITNALTAFNSNGYSVGNYVSINGSGESIVNWAWKANGAGVTNTAGSITSTVSANTTSGFSVVTYTGTGAAATVGHGLNVAPSMVIVKNRVDGAASWMVYHASVTVGATPAKDCYLVLNATSAAGAANLWNSVAPTSSTFSVSNNFQSNGSSQGMVAYCFAPIAGFSAFGSYAGNGSTDGPFIYTGFRPRFIMVKRTDTTGNWCLFDSSRLGYNGASASKELYPNLSIAEGTSNGPDQLSNGFKFRDTYADVNASGGTYIYACFAENPFKNSLAR